MKIVVLIVLQFIGVNVFYAQDDRVQTLLSDFSMDSVVTNVKKLSGELPITLNGSPITITSRLYNNIGNEQTYQYLKSKLIEYGYSIDSLEFSTNGKNLFGIKKGTVFPNRICMLGAHYDNLPTGSIAPGVDDNASGTCAVLEAARLMSTKTFPNTVVFAFWDEEELGLIGSTAFANQFNSSKDSLLGYINLDMIAWDSDNDMSTHIQVRPVSNSSSLSELAKSCNTLYNIGLNVTIIDPGSPNTDHYPFWQNDLTAIGISEEYQGDFNWYWHTVNDILGNTNLEYFTKNARLALFYFSTLAYNKSGNQTTEEIINNAVTYPNPVETMLEIQFQQAVTQKIELEICNIYGEVLKSNSFNNIDVIDLDFSNYSSGTYFIHLFATGNSKIFKIQKI